MQRGSPRPFKVPERVAEMLDRILADDGYRLSLEANALVGMRIPAFGKFGEYLGPRSKVNALRCVFRQAPHIDNLKDSPCCDAVVIT